MNDDRPIEKLLRRYAKKRRDATGPPVTLHPATRRLLQGEVARQFRKAAPGGVPALLAQIFRGWRAQLAWAVPLFALVAIGLWSLLDRPAKKQLALGPALNQTTPADRSRASTAAETAPDDLNAVKATLPPPVSVPVRALNQPAPGLADPGRARENRDAEQALAFGAAPSQPIVSLAGVAEKKSELAHYGFKEVQRVDKLGVASTAAPATNRSRVESREPRADGQSDPRPLTLDFGRQALAGLPDTAITFTNLSDSEGFERDQAQTYSQSFANLAPESLKQKTAKAIAPTPNSPVLANFRVEQSGRQLRVVDSDGSTYIGETDVSPAVWADNGASKKEQAVQLFKSDGKLNQLPTAATSVPQQKTQNNLYRVTGTNRTLNQTVVFTWSYVEMTNEPVVALSGRISGDLNKDPQKLPPQLQNSFINGRAQFETGKEIEINAVPVAP